MGITYAKAGVNIDEGERFVRLIKHDVRRTFSPAVLRDIGSFGGFYDGRFRGMKSPVLVSSMDGVGTKLLVARMAGRHDTVGQDLVNHCVNDILVCGARPLFFLDYLSTGKLDAGVAAEVIRGFTLACRQNGCALVGGETAEMPGMYSEGEYDLAGAIVGVVERRGIVDGRKIRRGDVLLGLRSSGLHTNGYSLARAVLFRHFSIDSYIDELQATLGDALLTVHRSYWRTVGPLLPRLLLHGMAHITGGGIAGNIARILPKGRSLRIDWGSWERPRVFSLMQRLGEVPEEDMRRTFNLGIGLVLVVSPRSADTVLRFLRRRRDSGTVIGEVV
jgi:phosphoribosylformylglycinamidine cyclo-ligase